MMIEPKTVPDWLDEALWIEQAYSCCAGIINKMWFPKNQVNMTYSEFKLRYAIKSIEETCLYDWDNLEHILISSLALNEDDLIYFHNYLKSQTKSCS